MNFTDFCAATSIIGNVDKPTAYSVTVDAPAAVQAGQTFTYRVQNLASAYPDKDSGATTTNITRLKADYAIPANSTFVSAAVVPGTGVNVNTGVAPNVLRVNTSGVADPAGTIVRLSGNNAVIANGANNSTNSEGGIVAAKTKKNLDGSVNAAGDSWFQLPAVDITVVAGAPGVIQPKLRTTGNAALYNNNENWYTLLAKASLLGTQWAPTRCVPSDTKNGALNAGAGPLATINVTAADVATTTALTAPATATNGQSVSLSATVSPAEAGGTVQFKDGATDLGAPVAVNAGVATLDHTFTDNGAHSITAVYSGAAGFITSTSAASVVDVSAANVATTTALTAPATATEGLSVDLSAAVSPAEAGGTVQFKDGATDLGAPVPVTTGVATLAHTFTGVGAHSITAVYSGGTGFLASTSAASVVDVSAADVATTTALTAPATATEGLSVDLSAAVSPAQAGGTVQFKDGATDLGAPVPVTAGVATLAHTFTGVGAHSITAVYSGGTGFLASTSAASVVDVSAADVATTTALTAPATATNGQSVSLSATVSPAEAGGTVQFKDGATDLGAPVAVNAGVATLDHTFTDNGAHSITAVYSGGTGFLGSTSAASVIDVSAANVATTTALTVPATATNGVSVSLSATVSPAEAGGTVQFKDGATDLGAPVAVNAGVATLDHTFTDNGAHSITAVYSGGTGFLGSTSAASVIDVSAANVATTTTLDAPATATTGQSVTLSATVSPEGDGGTVEFFDGAASIGTAPVTAGVAVLTHTFTAAGAPSVTAVYSGATGFLGSTSAASVITVTDPAPGDVNTTTTLTAPATATTGQSVTLSATVSPEATGGTVQFFDGTNTIGGPVTVVNGVATLPHTFTTTGGHSLHAEYSGTTGFIASNSDARLITVSASTTGGGTGSSF
ncbi:Ig-like domain-containing protein [Aldersonia sp. NBC_00410]|uniref:beta strand repeat-containing protein n=1 Tax=Aldersonia sp. NBC_00410 TaxID=2975954 RepID=UPI002250E1A9|nr:Ig-like domain-containing protein [Aldersonia sp. NBC_00410]MCX5043599.1 Ig-like domain-containing protein [Aldersonia sp. NBC_00410]